jgi:hypothetical protein
MVEEISDVSRRAQRSVAFVVMRALSAARDARPVKIGDQTSPLPLTTDDEDPPNLLKQPPSAESVAGAWPLSREKFFSWLKKLEEAQKLERADDLDAALAQAAHEQTDAARLGELAKSEYPRVRALVATHKNTPAEVIERLLQDRERSVREAASAHG